MEVGARFRELRVIPKRAILLAVGVVLSGSLAANAIGNIPFATWWPFLDSPAVRVLLAIALCLVFLAFIVMLYLMRSSFVLPKSLSPLHVWPHKVLILLVSPQKPLLLKDVPESGDGELLIDGSRRIPLEFRSLDASIPRVALESADKRWNWLQLLRAVSHHQGVVRRIYLVGSADRLGGDPGSWGELDLCVKLLGRFLPGVELIKATRAVEFELFGEVKSAIEDLIQHERSKYGTHDSGILINVTGGLKTASIAAAAVTLTNGVKFQYITTLPAPAGKEPAALVYDIAYERPQIPPV